MRLQVGRQGDVGWAPTNVSDLGNWITGISDISDVGSQLLEDKFCLKAW
jgi:hypothetical protein